MVATFLSAELDSPRFRQGVIDALAVEGKTRALVEKPDLSSTLENEARIRVLRYRGYPQRTALFTGFPRVVEWWETSVTVDDLAAAKVINSDSWPKWAGPSRLAREAANTLSSGTVDDAVTEHIDSVRKRFTVGYTLPALILAGTSLSDPMVILEGNVRVMAVLLSNPKQEVPAIVGVSPELRRWAFY